MAASKRSLKATRSSRVSSKALLHVVQIRVRRVPYYGGLSPHVWRTVPGFSFARIEEAQQCLSRMDSTLPARIVERMV